MRIYLAGKVGKNDWRHSIVGPDLRGANGAGNWRDEQIRFGERYVYTGPFFVGCDHGCSHFSGEHGVGSEYCVPRLESANDFVGDFDRRMRAPGDVTTGDSSALHYDRICIFDKCREAIDESDLVFAWLDDPTAHGTLWELGFAAGRGIPTAVGIPERFDATDLWFPIYGSGQFYRARTAAEAFARSVGKVDAKLMFAACQSPIERELLTYLLEMMPKSAELVPQYQFEGYRIDFALIGNGRRVAIECDGHDFHERTKEQARHDRSRDRRMTAAGWAVCRFTGSEIHKDARRCAMEAIAFLKMEAA